MTKTLDLDLDHDAAELSQRFSTVVDSMRTEVGRVIVGQEDVVDHMLITLFVGGHCLVTGMPGTAKTLLVRTMADALGLEFNRIQFTPDLMPTDITGTDIIDCLLYTSPSPRDRTRSRMPSSA